MEDRVSIYPGRVTLTPVAGQANTYDMVRADSPTQEGTPLNKNNLLKDSTAALYGLGEDAVPDEVLAKAKELIAANSTAIANGVKIVTGSYVGTGTYGSSNPCSLTFDFVPKLFIVSSSTTSIDDYDEYSIMYNPVEISFSCNSNYSNKIKWEANSISWYNLSKTLYQYNVSGSTYYYVVIG